MKVLHLIHQYLPEHVGGTELYSQWLVSSLRRRGHEMSVFYRRDAEGQGLDHRQDPTGVPVYAAWSGRVTPWQRFRATWGEGYLESAFRQVLEQAQPHLVHTQHLMGLPANLIYEVKKREIPLIITLHDYWWVCANAQLLTNYSQQVCNGPWAYLNCARCALARAGHPDMWPVAPALTLLLARRNRELRQVLDRAARLIAPTRFVAEWYAAHGVARGRLTVVPHGLDIPSSLPRTAARPGRPVRFAYIGGLAWQKGVHVLLEAFRDTPSGGELWIAGDEAAYPEYTAQLRARAASNVRFLGRLTREQVWSTLAQVDVLVVPSLWYETFVFVVSEAFAAGVPVIASRLGPLAERVRHGVDGLLTPPGDSQALREALARLIENPGLLIQLQAGIEPPKTMETHAAEMEAIYADVLRPDQRTTSGR